MCPLCGTFLAPALPRHVPAKSGSALINHLIFYPHEGLLRANIVSLRVRPRALLMIDRRPPAAPTVSDGGAPETCSGLSTYTGMRRLGRPHIDKCKKTAPPYLRRNHVGTRYGYYVLRPVSDARTGEMCSKLRKYQVYRSETSPPFPHQLTHVNNTTMFPA